MTLRERSTTKSESSSITVATSTRWRRFLVGATSMKCVDDKGNT
jgi:hypothetical protein